MLKPELFHKSVGILVNAYLNDTLVPSQCSACAVGNLVAGNIDVPLTEKDAVWYTAVWPLRPSQRFTFDSILPERMIEGRKQVEATGYSAMELMRIEEAFMSTRATLPSGADRIFQKLMGVVDVLADIHQMDVVAKEQAKSLFPKQQPA